MELREDMRAVRIQCCLNTGEVSAPPATRWAPGVYFELAAWLFFAASLACTALGIPCPNWLTVRTSFTSPVYKELESQAYRDGARISSNSWGSLIFTYTADSQQYDALVRDVFARNVDRRNRVARRQRHDLPAAAVK